MKALAGTVLAAALCAALALSARAQTPPRPSDDPGAGSQYTLAQATSDRAQLDTIAFDGLAFLTGSFAADTFLPPGKIADYYGFQYMRDVQPHAMGHNTDFLTRISNNMISVLTAAQRAQLITLGAQQASQVKALAYMRFPLIQAFRRQLTGAIPKGSAGLGKAAVMKADEGIFALDGEIAYERAVVYAGILRSLTEEQKAYLAKLKFADYSTWPEMAEPLDKSTMSHDTNVLVMSYGGDMFSWYAGSLEADTYFCPERHGTYFGSFYLKDAPAMGQANYTIDTALTGDSGARLLATLTPAQRGRITTIVGVQRAGLQEIVKVRRAISTELRKLLTQGTADKALVLSLSKRYGQLDGELSYYYATRFAEVGKSLTGSQRAALVKLRNLSTTPHGAFLYSDPIPAPKIPNTDYLFAASGR